MEHIVSVRTFNTKTGRFKRQVDSDCRYFAYLNGKNPNEAFLPSATVWADHLIEHSNQEEVLIYVHGFNNTHHDVRRRLKTLRIHLANAGFSGAVAAFDWPSDTNLDLEELVTRDGYQQVVGKAHLSAPFLIDNLINLLWKRNKKLKINLLAHSLGARLVVEALLKVGSKGAPLTLPNALHHVAFVAADIDQNAMMKGAGYASALERNAEGLTSYYSEVDRVLDVSGKPLFNRYSRRVGQYGLKPNPPEGFADVATLNRYLALLPEGHAPETIGSHNWYFDDTAAFYPDLIEVLKGKNSNFSETRRDKGDGDMELVF